jgi:hypothetical protein
MSKIIVITALLAFGCMNSKVATGTNTPYKRSVVRQTGLIEYNEWHYARLKSVKGGKLYALMIEKDGNKLVAHCMETVYPYHKHSYGPFDKTVLWQKCTSEWVIGVLKQIEDPK